ncbi:UDP-glucose glucosyltransferase [Striga asiatica]|uniref:Glycosyltransferase n=1 Tax=Striga asiatica TaxID=4170 RepID=A0A5A7P005_STRAF|nr:UDP-glucose glucosyltransferase [Striga asiatica]
MATTTTTETLAGETGQPAKVQLAVIVVPLLLQGHLNQLLHLSHRISARGIPVHFAAPSTHNRQARARAHNPASSPDLIFHDLPMPEFENPSPNPNAANKFPAHMMPLMWATTDLRQPVFQLAEEVSSVAEKIVVIYDSLMAHVVQDILTIPNAKSYSLESISAFALYSYFWETSAAGKPVFPAGVEVVGEVGPTEGSYPPELLEFVGMVDSSPTFNSGEILNTSREVEGFYVDLLAKEKLTGTGKIWAVGPFYPVVEIFERNNKSSGCHSSRDKSLEWLDKQGRSSVVFVSFGTTSSLPEEQIFEIARGLERSECKFLWVLRDADKGDVFAGDDVRRAPLPQGFEERVKGRGLIVRDWAPQLEILGHPSVGGFMSHCGWNSCMESMSLGVPIIAWPMHSDQPRNAILLTNLLKIGIQITDWEHCHKIVKSGAVEKAVKILMASEEGDEVRKRADRLGIAVRESLKEGGATAMEMDSFIEDIKK